MTWTYAGISEEQLHQVAAKLEQPFSISGVAKTHGVRISWEYQPDIKVLAVTAHNETWLVKYDRIKKGLDEILTPAIST